MLDTAQPPQQRDGLSTMMSSGLAGVFLPNPYAGRSSRLFKHIPILCLSILPAEPLDQKPQTLNPTNSNNSENKNSHNSHNSSKP